MYLPLLTLMYLLIPVILLLIGWVHFTVWISLLVLFVVSGHICIDEMIGTKVTSIIRSQPKAFLFALILVIIWCVLSGSGGVFAQNNDYQKHNAILHELVTNSWPVTYSINDESHSLIYYLAYYLPAAAIGKMANISVAQSILLIWTTFGVMLAVFYLQNLSGAQILCTVIFFIFFSGLDPLGATIIGNAQIISGPTYLLEWWAGGHWQYSSNTTLLFWVPQHALSGWLSAALLVDLILNKRESRLLAPLVMGIAPFWSTFVALGLIPLFLILFIKRQIKISWHMAAPVILLLLALMFFSAKDSKLPMGMMWNFHPFPEVLPNYIMFFLVEAGLYLWLLVGWPQKGWLSNVPLHKGVWQTIAVCLFFIPFVHMGIYNDFPMRSSIPLLFVLQVMLLTFLTSEANKSRKLTLSILLVIGSYTAWGEIHRAITTQQHSFDFIPIMNIGSDGVQYVGKRLHFPFR